MPDSPVSAAGSFFVTTPIYYVNARPHIGHAYTTIVADVVARRHRLLGQPTFFLTGTDEHGQKIERSAAAAGIPPLEFADQVAASFRALWDRMGITYDDFIRTTEPRHAAGVQHLFQQLRNNNAIYKGTYTGQYCVSDEAYVDGPPGIHCPDCGRLTETVSEENFYFRLSAFQLPLLNLIESNTLRIEPDSRRNEVLSFLRGNVAAAQTSTQTPGAPSTPQRDMGGNADPQLGTQSPGAPSTPQSGVGGNDSPQTTTLPRTAANTPYVPGALKDLSISRTSFSWGIPVPGDEKHVIYVWLDALANYMTALGYGQETKPLFDQFWPADLHLVGKEIIRFHCVYWPAFLLALDPNWATHAQPAEAFSLLSSRSGAKGPASPGEPAPGAPSMAQRDMGGNVSPQSATPLGFDPAWAVTWLPKSVVAHGWLLFEESKMSKSRGNIVRTETILQAFGDQFLQGIRDHNARELKKNPTFQPVPEPPEHDRDLFASDVLRYFLLREIPFGQDGSFSFDAMITRYNADLANGYGNLVSRVLTMVEKNLGGELGRADETLELPASFQVCDMGGRITGGSLGATALRKYVVRMIEVVDSKFPQWNFSSSRREGVLEEALRLEKESEIHDVEYGLIEAIASAVSATDLYLTASKPWQQAGNPELRRSILYTAAESIRILTALLYPILPFSTARVWAQLGLGSIEDAAREGKLTNLQWGGLTPGTKLGPLAPIFPRADTSPDKGLARAMADIESNARPASLANTANDQRDAATSDHTPFREAPLASAAPGTPDQLAAAEAKSEAATQTPGAPSMAQGDMGGNVNRSTTPAQPATQTPGAPSIPQSGMGGSVNPPTADPTAAPRTSTLVEGEPLLNVAGSTATTTAAPSTTTHVDAEPSGIFASTSAGTSISAAPADASPQITIGDFAKVELRIAQILSAERIPKADKLLLLEVDLGYERRQILSGIAEWYTPAEIVGLRIIVITNLAPRKMRGLTSHGMLLAASGPADGPGGARPIFVTVPEPVPVGTRLK